MTVVLLHGVPLSARLYDGVQSRLAGPSLALTLPGFGDVPPLPGPPKFDAFGKPIPGSQRIPLASLVELFGPEVKKALATLEQEKQRRAAGQPSELMDLLIAFRQAEMFRLGAPVDPGLVPLGRRGVKSAGPARGT